MALPGLQYTKSWLSPSDFPTDEPSEEQVRADMQLLHDETKGYINDDLRPYLASTDAAWDIGAQPFGDYTSTTVQGLIEETTNTLQGEIDAHESRLNSSYTSAQMDSLYLRKGSVVEFIPTMNYDPATKKYVDDAAAPSSNLLNNTLANNITPDNSQIQVNNGGVWLERNVADTQPVVTIRQNNLSGHGKLLSLKQGIAEVASIDEYGTIVCANICIQTTKTPASATATGTKGTICWDANYLYICVATNTWKRIALSTW